MIQVIGLKKNIELEIREKLSLNTRKQEEFTNKLLNYFNEVVIISTCNRTEVYLNSSYTVEEGLEKVFQVFNWDLNFKKYCFCLEEENTIKHLMEVVSGFHSKILGEDQILGQIKNAYKQSLKLGSVKLELQRLFQEAITCGKRFRTEGKLYEIPVSSSSIAINEAINSGAKNFMVIGFGEVGKLVVKYALAHDITSLILVVRNVESITDLIDSRVKVMNYDEGRENTDNIECIISCTSAPHLVIEKKHVKKDGNPLIIFDLALPRDIEKEIGDYKRVKLYDIDDISAMDDVNKKLRNERMQYFKYITNDAIKEYIDWKKLRGISPHIKNIKEAGNKVVEERCDSFYNKCKNSDDIKLAKTLIKSTSDAYVNRAIEVLKEEKLKGCEDECLRILEKIFELRK
ncbi:glutamyl-tRNA reductase [Clostridium gasigenes]|uniref:glutamyl-tRNA reductase n=1 Tax=Clostridium gasigenes TaxID=94869 RepID=UPI00143836A6|nr:glutamyl-tRNA reductase [Clostridium gasigenes]NKF08720.1 glutamyl-tRNA reductase [Clostridium gasigenes]QSW19992.1 glutamyl-tRNA reductase [Clostridium gasigenes]